MIPDHLAPNSFLRTPTSLNDFLARSASYALFIMTGVCTGAYPSAIEVNLLFRYDLLNVHSVSYVWRC